MAKRTEEEKLTQAPLQVILGGETYEVKPLVIAKARSWRISYDEAMNSLNANIAAQSDKPEDFRTGLATMLLDMPNVVIDLFFGYAIDLDRKAIEDVATEKEIGVAFMQVQEVAFPLVYTLVGAGMMRLKTTPPQEKPQTTPNRAQRRKKASA